jgi:hypothetical protein
MKSQIVAVLSVRRWSSRRLLSLSHRVELFERSVIILHDREDPILPPVNIAFASNAVCSILTGTVATLPASY